MLQTLLTSLKQLIKVSENLKSQSVSVGVVLLKVVEYCESSYIVRVLFMKVGEHCESIVVSVLF